MQAYTTPGYKDNSTKTVFVLTGVFLLLAINGFVLFYIYTQQFVLVYLVGVLLLGRMFWRMWRLITKLQYTFDNEGVTVILPSGKSHILSHKNITSVEKVGSIPWWYTFGIKYNFWTKEIHFTTARKNLIKISLSDGKSVVISPKKIDPEIFS